MRTLLVLMLAIPMLAGCTTPGDGDAASEEDVQAAWADYQAASGPEGDLSSMALAADVEFAFGDTSSSISMSGAADLFTDGFQYAFVFDEMVFSADGEQHDLSGIRMDLTCDPDGLRATSEGMAEQGSQEIDVTVDVGGDCWDDEAVGQAMGSDVGFSMDTLTAALRGDFGGNIVLDDTRVTDAGTIAEYRVAIEGLTTDMDVLVDDGRVRQIALSMDQSMATVDMVLDMTYGERGATPAHPAS